MRQSLELFSMHLQSNLIVLFLVLYRIRTPRINRRASYVELLYKRLLYKRRFLGFKGFVGSDGFSGPTKWET